MIGRGADWSGVECGERSVLPEVECGEIFPRWGGMRRNTSGTLRKPLEVNVECGEKRLGSRSLCIFYNTLMKSIL
jgi:hypothetical protein